MKHQKQNLLINGDVYTKEVEAPPLKEVLLQKPTEIDVFQQLKIHSAP